MSVQLHHTNYEMGSPGSDWLRAMTPDGWANFRTKLLANRRLMSAANLFNDSAPRAGIYRWGVAAAAGTSIDGLWKELSQIARRPASLPDAEIDWVDQSVRWKQQFLTIEQPTVLDCAGAVLWAAGLPGLIHALGRTDWSEMWGTLAKTWEAMVQSDEKSSPAHLILGGELGLTLAGCMSDFPTSRATKKIAAKSLRHWCDHDIESVAFALDSPTDARLVLASLIRSLEWLRVLKLKQPKSLSVAGDHLATWIAATLRPDGTAAFSKADKKSMKDDLVTGGLLDQAKRFDPESTGRAIEAAIGKSDSGGRLAWMVSLPESLNHDTDAKVASMFCEWDVRRGKTMIHYAGEEMNVEIAAGKRMALSGLCQSQIDIDGQSQDPIGDWSMLCEFTDDDVHYLEFEQAWSGNLTLQRQMLLFRDDRCLMFADAVIQTGRASLESADTEREVDKTSSSKPMHGRRIHYACRIPIAEGVSVTPEEETRELFFGFQQQRRVLAIPLAANEWKVGPSDAAMRVTPDQHLVSSATGIDRLYCPMWFDFLPRRFKRKRTWRRLTVAENLRIVGPNEAAAFRVQQGSEHWVIYRSLLGQASRTFLGKHLIADFYCSRFDPSDGIHEELVTVDDHDDDPTHEDE